MRQMFHLTQFLLNDRLREVISVISCRPLRFARMRAQGQPRRTQPRVPAGFLRRSRGDGALIDRIRRQRDGPAFLLDTGPE